MEWLCTCNEPKKWQHRSPNSAGDLQTSDNLRQVSRISAWIQHIRTAIYSLFTICSKPIGCRSFTSKSEVFTAQGQVIFGCLLLSLDLFVSFFWKSNHLEYPLRVAIGKWLLNGLNQTNCVLIAACVHVKIRFEFIIHKNYSPILIQNESQSSMLTIVGLVRIVYLAMLS